jgi:exodeoxyribonuclease VII large subunit
MRARERLAGLDAAAVFARMQHGLARRQQRADELRFRLESLWERQCTSHGQRLHNLRLRLMQQDVSRQLALHGERLRGFDQSLRRAGDVLMELRRVRWSRTADRLNALSPLAVLDRGYALVYTEADGEGGGALVKDSARVQPGENLRIRFARGRARARVIETE